jgi:hypothetical protein
MLVTWGVDNAAEITTGKEFEDLLDALTVQCSGYGMIVQITHPNGSTLAIGLGREESVLTYFDGQGSSFTSVGDRDREDYLAFEFEGDVSEMMGAKAVSELTARAAAREFSETGKLPQNVEWEKEWA